jgi:hypothetical protein
MSNPSNCASVFGTPGYNSKKYNEVAKREIRNTTVMEIA